MDIFSLVPETIGNNAFKGEETKGRRTYNLAANANSSNQSVDKRVTTPRFVRKETSRGMILFKVQRNKKRGAFHAPREKGQR